MKPISLITIILLSFLVGFLVGRRGGRIDPGLPPVERVDTLIIRDTISVSEPIFVKKKVIDSVLVQVTDTIRMRDTLYVYMEREQVTWQDSLARVYASGINPQVDSVIHFTKERIITREIPVIHVKKTRWGVGIQAGMGAGKEGFFPYVGAGVSYNLLSW